MNLSSFELLYLLRIFNDTFKSRKDVDTFPVSRETEPYDGAREASSLILLMKRFSVDLNRQLARGLSSVEILAQKGENLLLNSFSDSQSRYSRD
jgi:hypothetical protein